MAVSKSPTVGRPRSFDEDVVLDALIALFWRKGYSQTSMTDIVEASGVHKPSLYRVFGSKDEIFAAVLRRYLDAQMDMIDQLVERSGAGAAGVREFLDEFAAIALADAGRNGCLLVVASNELSGTIAGYEDFATSYRNALRVRLTTLLGKEQPALDDAVIGPRAELLTTFLAGFQVAVRAGAPDDELGRIVGSMHTVIESW